MRNLFATLTKVMALAFLLGACSTQKQLAKVADRQVIGKEGMSNAHIGIAIYEPASGQFLYQHNAGKYFVPASNTKLFSLYAGLKYIGDTLPAIRYHETADSIYLEPTGDPSFLHSDYPKQPLVAWLKAQQKPLVLSDANWQSKQWGMGWSWDDFNSSYMAERSPLPVYGNVIKWTQTIDKMENALGEPVEDVFVYSDPEVNWKVRLQPERGKSFSVVRDRYNNIFTITEGKEPVRTVEVPFVTNGVLSALDLLRDTIGKSITYIPASVSRKGTKVIWSQPTDSMLAPMMHRSDNLFAEQTLLVASQQLLGVMDTERIIDTLLRSDLKGLPHPPRWADGSGLSRYNLFTPADFIWLLEKMEREFGANRLELILPAGDEGTLANYYKDIKGKIHAKTGTLSGVVGLSGYLQTSKGRRLLFSVLVNNHNTSASAVRRSVEQFLMHLYKTY